MPCNDGGDVRVRVEYRDNPKVSAMLCAVLSSTAKLNLLEIVLKNADWKESGVSSTSTLAWWEQHQVTDNRRREREARQKDEERRQKLLLESAKKKLSPAELIAIRRG